MTRSRWRVAVHTSHYHGVECGPPKTTRTINRWLTMIMYCGTSEVQTMSRCPKHHRSIVYGIGCGEDLIAEKYAGALRSPTASMKALTFGAANGPTVSNQGLGFHVKAFGQDNCQARIPSNTAVVLSIGLTCRKLGWLLFWIGNKRPCMVTRARLIVPFLVKGDVPYLDLHDLDKFKNATALQLYEFVGLCVEIDGSISLKPPIVHEGDATPQRAAPAVHDAHENKVSRNRPMLADSCNSTGWTCLQGAPNREILIVELEEDLFACVPCFGFGDQKGVALPLKALKDSPDDPSPENKDEDEQAVDEEEAGIPDDNADPCLPDDSRSDRQDAKNTVLVVKDHSAAVRVRNCLLVAMLACRGRID